MWSFIMTKWTTNIMSSFTLLFVFIGFQCINGNPEPLVSSSGIIPMTRLSENAYRKELKVLTNEKSQLDDIPASENQYAGVPIPQPRSEEALHIVQEAVPIGITLPILSSLEQQNSDANAPPASGTTIDMAADPLLWRQHVPDHDKEEIEDDGGALLASHDAPDTDSTRQESQDEPENVIYSKKLKSVLRPYARDSDLLLTIPTMIITPSTTENVLQNSTDAITVPPQIRGRSIVMHSGIQENSTSTNKSGIDGGEAAVNESSKIIISSPKFVFVDENNLNNDMFDDLEAPSRIIRTSHNDTTEPQEKETTENPNPDIDDEAVGNDQQVTTKLGAPWDDDEIVGKLFEDVMILPTEVSFKVASKLCQKITRQMSSISNQPKRYYLWAPINQYLPLLRKAFPIRPPLFAPECLKWVLRQCRGSVRLPLLKPCTYWAPMPIRRPECGFNPNLQSKIVNYRLPEFVPGNCPCVWPCTKRFDPIQRCRITVNESEHQFDHIHSDGDPWNEKEIFIQDNLAAQLCRGMKLALTVDHTIPIGWLPIRVDIKTDGEGDGEVYEAASHPGTVRRKREEQPSTDRKSKREQIYVKPDKETPASSEEEGDDGSGNDQGDRFTLTGTYNLDRQISQGGNGTGNMTTIRQCNVWRYKACPRDQNSLEEQTNEYTNIVRRKKRSIPRYLSRLALGLHDESGGEFMWDKPRFVRESQLDEDDIIYAKTADCGEWIKTESFQCIPEQHIPIVSKGSADSSSEESEGGGGDPLKTSSAIQKKKVMKDLCPGSVGEFPCFLRKKRSVLDETGEEQLELQKNEDDTQKTQNKRDAVDQETGDEVEVQSSTFLIDKILIRPDSSCMCDWPCLPFFDRVNRCYNSKGGILLDQFGRPKIAGRSFRTSQRDPVVCINFVEVDEIYCKIKE